MLGASLQANCRKHTTLSITGREVVGEIDGLAVKPADLVGLDVSAQHRSALHKLLCTLAETIATTKVSLDGLDQLARSPRCQRPAVQVPKRQKPQLAAIREMSVRVSARYRHIIGRPGDAFESWMAKLIAQKISMLSEVEMKDFESRGALVYASRRGGTIRFDSEGEHSNAYAAFAARCSMSIPFLFRPQYVDGRRVVDGGMRNNFPLDRFLKDHPKTHFIGVYLGKRGPRNRTWFVSELLDIWLEGEERETVDAHADAIVVIDTSPIGTIDFGMTDDEKAFLVQVGRAAALRLLYKRKLDGGPSEQEVQEAERKAESGRKAVISARQRKRARRAFWAMLIFVVVFTIYAFSAA